MRLYNSDRQFLRRIEILAWVAFDPSNSTPARIRLRLSNGFGVVRDMSRFPVKITIPGEDGSVLAWSVTTGTQVLVEGNPAAGLITAKASCDFLPDPETGILEVQIVAPDSPKPRMILIQSGNAIHQQTLLI